MEIMRGSPAKNKIYCSKEESRLSKEAYINYCAENGMPPIFLFAGPHENGDCPGPQGKRNDLEDAYEDLKTMNIYDVAVAHPATYMKYHAGMGKLKFMMDQEKAQEWREVNVIVLHGATGSGKTRTAIAAASTNAGGSFLIRKDDGKSIWWDGYHGQKTLVMDEYHGNWMRYKALLGILDGHPYRVPIKGSHAWATWTTVFITSSTSYKGWYQREEYSELERRITDVIHIDPLAASMPPNQETTASELPPEAQSGGNTSPTSGGLSTPPLSPVALERQNAAIGADLLNQLRFRDEDLLCPEQLSCGSWDEINAEDGQSCWLYDTDV